MAKDITRLNSMNGDEAFRVVDDESGNISLYVDGVETGVGVVDIGDNATYTVLTRNSGKTHFLPDLTADIVISLPTASAGLTYEFVYAGVAADAQDWQLDTGSDTNFFLGGLAHLDTDAGSAGDEVVPIAGDGDSNSKVNILVPGPGTHIKVICDGTNWILSGMVVGATVPSFADQ